MKQTVLKPWTMAACMLALVPVHAQVSTTLNNGIATDFVGWDNTMINDPLMIRHDANWPIDWYTNAIQRMRLLPTGQTVINGYTLSPTDQDGFLLLSATDNAFTNLFSNAPFSRLLLAQVFGRRSLA